ncbi:hypothetical protein [Ureibacillus sinduriensis]|uniref:Uncharacterized protein n=1 Tax=Ureibacillus sinduriensis BLB-1 = JCM 15800 TaxID=1384057 RepID=A0A0A3HTB9_9BACL|nr:hypothetical protein [Ureibacillus sinduriensis]KGR74465.1 hypothetical protein CD33_15315 [Ureibacillus sinduriensis BLB-1 = JCM 15800]
MSTRMPVENTVNLLQLKEQLDEIVFNYIDTNQKWDIAYSKLDSLLKKVLGYYESYMKANGDNPKENTTANLLLNMSYKLIFFHTVSYYRLKETNQEAVKVRVLELLSLAANCIPDVQKENHAEYLEEIAEVYSEISKVQGSQQKFVEGILEKNNRITDCFASFSKAINILSK